METKDSAAPLTLNLAHGRVVMLWKLVEYTGLVLFVVLVPRAMGPERYGAFAALLASVTLMTIASGFGGRIMLARFVPEHRVHGEDSRIAVLFSQLFLLRLGVALVLGLVWAVFSSRLLPEVSTLVVLFGAGAVVFAIVGMTCYDLFYSLNALNRWLFQRCLMHITLLMFLVVVGGRDKLERAGAALLLTHLLFLAFGLTWAWPYFTRRGRVLGFSGLLTPLRFAAAFFIANLLLVAILRGGELMVLWLSGRPAEVAFYNIANSAAVAFASLVAQLTGMLLPSMVAHDLSGEGERNESVVGHSLKYLTIASFCFLFAVHTAGPWVVRHAIGERFLPVVANLKVLAFGLLPLALVNLGVSLAVVQNQAGKALRVAGGALAVYVVSSVLLVPRGGSYGACLAMIVAMGAAGLLTYHEFSLGPALAIARFGRLLGAGLISLVVLLFPLTPTGLAGPLAGVVFAVLLLASGTVSRNELWRLWQAMVSPPRREPRMRRA